jgi:hypothetical protein
MIEENSFLFFNEFVAKSSDKLMDSEFDEFIRKVRLH